MKSSEIRGKIKFLLFCLKWISNTPKDQTIFLAKIMHCLIHIIVIYYHFNIPTEVPFRWADTHLWKF